MQRRIEWLDSTILDMRRAKLRPPEIALALHLSVSRVYLGITRQRERERLAANYKPPKLTPFYPITPLVPASCCPHRAPIRRGSVLYCEICGKTGIDHHPALQRDAATDPKPEPKPKTLLAKLTRKQRRSKKRQHATSNDSAITVSRQ